MHKFLLMRAVPVLMDSCEQCWHLLLTHFQREKNLTLNLWPTFLKTVDYIKSCQQSEPIINHLFNCVPTLKCSSSCVLKVLKAAVMPVVRSDSDATPGSFTGSSFSYDSTPSHISPAFADGPASVGEQSKTKWTANLVQTLMQIYMKFNSDTQIQTKESKINYLSLPLTPPSLADNPPSSFGLVCPQLDFPGSLHSDKAH